MILLLSIGSAQAADCSNAALSTALQSVTTASLRSDQDADAALLSAMDEATATFDCLVEIVDPTLAARFHHVQALSSFLSGDQEQCVDSFVAGRMAAPGLIPDLSGWPAFHPFRSCYARSVEVEPTSETLARQPTDGWLAIDGHPQARRGQIPTGRTYVIQWWVDEGTSAGGTQIRDTRYVTALDAPPDYLATPKSWNRGLLRVGLGTVALGGLSLAGSVPAHFAAQGSARNGNADGYDSLVTTNHALVVGGAIVAGLGGSLVLAARF